MEEDKPQNALEFTASKGLVNVTAQIIEQQIEKNSLKPDELDRALVFAMESDHLATAKLLVESGANANKLGIKTESYKKLDSYSKETDGLSLKDIEKAQNVEISALDKMKQSFQNPEKGSTMVANNTPHVKPRTQNNSRGR